MGHFEGAGKRESSWVSHNAPLATIAMEHVAFLGAPRQRRVERLLRRSIITLFILLALNVSVALFTIRQGDNDDQDPTFPDWGKEDSGTEDRAWYPTDFLRDVQPVPCHSHNDYWRKVPLFSALHAGCIGVEADVWLFPDRSDVLLVGHDRAALQAKRTFASLYIDPLVEILTRQNPSHEFYNETRRGVFDVDPEQTLTLLVDVKTSGPETWRKVVEQLEPLRSRGWLSEFRDGKVTYGPITVVGTGNAPFEVLMENTTHRDYFFDAPLNNLDEDGTFNATNSHYASVEFSRSVGLVWFGGLSEGQLERVRRHVAAAHKWGLKARYWNLPAWPIHVRNRVWDTLVEEGVDILNVDDLESATKKDWSKTRFFWG